MTSGKRFLLFLSTFLLLIVNAAQGKPTLEFPEFVITVDKFQTLLWREFLIAFPNIYAKKCYKIYNPGSVVFHDADQQPTLSFFADQEIKAHEDGITSRVTRLNMRSSTGQAFMDIIVRDVGRGLKKTPMTQLLMGRLPLDLDESALREKNISISGGKLARMKIRCLIQAEDAANADITFNVVSGNHNLFRISEIRRDDSRELTWFLDRVKNFKGRHTLRAKKVKTHWMLVGSEEFYVDGRERTPGGFQSDFSKFGIQNLIVSFQEQMKGVIDSAICYPDCKDKARQER